MKLPTNHPTFLQSRRFHTKSTAHQHQHEPTCALCLLPLAADSDSKICDKCLKKHNLSARFPLLPPPPLQTGGGAYLPMMSAHANVALHKSHSSSTSSSTSSSLSPLLSNGQPPLRSPSHRGTPNPSGSNPAGACDPTAAAVPQQLRCQLCASSASHAFVARSAAQLQQHLIEHSFEGCDERGFACYICAAVFTAAAGLQLHMHELHGDGAKPYDCRRCAARFFFRAELQHHVLDAHVEAEPELDGRRRSVGHVEKEEMDVDEDVKSERSADASAEAIQADNDHRGRYDDEDVIDAINGSIHDKSEEIDEEDENDHVDQTEEADEEYIEVEKLGEAGATTTGATLPTGFKEPIAIEHAKTNE